MVDLSSTVIGAIIGALLSEAFRHLIPEEFKQQISFYVRQIRLAIRDRHVNATFSWEFRIYQYIDNIDNVVKELKLELERFGFIVNGDLIINLEKKDRKIGTLIIDYYDDERKLYSIQFSVRKSLSVRGLEGDILSTIDEPNIKTVLRVLEKRFDLHPRLYLEIVLNGLSNLSVLVKDLGIRFALVNSKFKLQIGSDKVSMMIDGFTKELLGILRRIIILYA